MLIIIAVLIVVLLVIVVNAKPWGEQRKLPALTESDARENSRPLSEVRRIQ